ncbi:glycoside hydrolase [Syncephalis plumigaleata]|nr:glycoside hydrolase [Syncephalis plumigaleata]
MLNPTIIFGVLFAITGLAPVNTNAQDVWQGRKQAVIDAISTCWHDYRANAFGADEYRPISKSGKQWADSGESLGYMIIDSLDTLLLANRHQEYEEGLSWIDAHLDFNVNSRINLFETTIRSLGGLLGAYTLRPDARLLRLARLLGDRLLPAFDTETGIPKVWFNLAKGNQGDERDPSSTWATLATVGTLQMEFRELSRLTNNPKYWQAAKRTDEALQRLPSYDGLLPMTFNLNGEVAFPSEYGFGGGNDSYYGKYSLQYLLKRWIQTARTESKLRDRYDASIIGARKHLVGYAGSQQQAYLGTVNDNTFVPRMEHLACTFGGVLALGSATDRASTSRAQRDMTLARGITDTCMKMHRTKSGLAPEMVEFTSTMQFMPNQMHNILRPETLESLFVLWRTTRNDQYREQAWQIFQAMLNNSSIGRATCLVSVVDVSKTPTMKQDSSETFYMAETLKYLLLIFDDDDNLLPLDRYVFNTEAHPFPIFTP